MKKIAVIHTDFSQKFGIPRQSNLVKELEGEIIFEEEYANPEAVRGLEGFTYIWLLWEFSEAVRDTWSPTVRPPRLGGDKRMGVFATRSPFRPNPIGLSSVRLNSIELRHGIGPVLHISGADLLDGTPIYDIKPYLPWVDAHTDAEGGFAAERQNYRLDVSCSEELLSRLPINKRQPLLKVLEQDPRPSYQDLPGREYGLSFAGKNIKFTVKEGRLYVTDIT